MVALNAALPDIALQTAATQTQLTWIVDGYTLVLACLLLPAGAIGDRYGRRGALLVGLAIFALASLAPTIFDSPVQIIVARAVAGVGAAFIMPATLSLLTAAFPKSSATRPLASGPAWRVPERSSGSWAPGCCCTSSRGSRSSTGSRPQRSALFVCTCTIASSRDETATPHRLDRRGAHRRRRRRFRVRRRRSAGARLDESDRLGLHVGRCCARRRLRGGRTAAQHPLLDVDCSRPDFATGPSASRSCSSPTSDSSSSRCSTCS